MPESYIERLGLSASAILKVKIDVLNRTVLLQVYRCGHSAGVHARDSI